MDNGSGISHRDIQLSIRWLVSAIGGLATVGAFALYLMSDTLDDFRRVLGEFQVSMESSVRDVSQQLGKTNDTMQGVRIELREANTKLEQTIENQRKHEGLPLSRAHGK